MRLLTLHDPARAKLYYEQGCWRGDTLYGLLAAHAKTNPDAFALRDSRRRLTYREVVAWVDSLADDFAEAGLIEGQRVSIWLPNRVEAVIVLLACSRNGYVCNPSLHQNYTVAEIVALLGRIKSAALFAQAGHGADAHRADIFAEAAKLPFLKRAYRLAPAGGEAGGTGHPFPSPTAKPRRLTAPHPSPDKITYLAFTSGTTGMPKGVMHSDNTLLANCRDLAGDWGHGRELILLSLSPLSHHIAWVAAGQVLVCGGELVVNDVPKGEKPLDWILESRATYVMGVPTHAIDILHDFRTRGLKAMGQVKVFYMAGAPIPIETARALLDIGAKPQNIYGMTENSSHQYTWPSDDEKTITETCGRGGKAYEVRIWSQENPNVEVAAGEIGEIGGRGASLMLGYFDNQEETEKSFNAGGWFMSGDLGRLDEKGCLQIMGRKKDLIIRGGHNIHPVRIEDLAMRSPRINKVAVFGVPDERLGEKVCIAVIPAAAISGDDMLRHLHREGLSIYDMPEYFIAMDAFPLTASGKILKRELVAWAKSGKVKPEPVRFVDPERRRSS
ncbi:MAG: cyclohexanecarboxylate-CoA ligase [Rhodospirillales bacterium]|nr:cyclohexanecarboxylate-CoA ligase [Rhodospirillales bacterium]